MTNENKQKQFIPCDCPKGGVYSDGQVCQKCGGTEYIEQKQSWEEIFDKEFVRDNGENIEPSFKDPNGDVGPVKQFISQEIQKAYQKGRERILNLIPNIVNPIPKEFHIEHTQGRNYAYNEIKNIINK